MTLRLTLALVALVATLYPGCAPPEHVPTNDEIDPPPHTPHNTLTHAEGEEGWRLLFDGQSLEHWRGFRMPELPAGWRVEDGTIHFVPPVEADAQRADLITRDKFGDFELALEWKVTPGGNSGLFFRVSEEAERTYYTGPEMQILDDALHPDGQRAETSAGSNYALHAPGPYPKRPAGEWNEVRLFVSGDHVEHWLNGARVVDYRLWTPEWQALVAASKFAAWPGYGQSRSGHIALQDHGNEIWFRNLRVRDLTEPTVE